MEITYKGWNVFSGKGDRVYIKYIGTGEEDRTIQNLSEQSFTSTNGILFYGMDKVKDLAVAISLFEHKMNESESIASILKEQIERLKYLDSEET